MENSDDLVYYNISPIISLYFAARVFSLGVRCAGRFLDWYGLSFCDSYCGKFECDVSTVDTINFRSDFHGTI